MTVMLTGKYLVAHMLAHNILSLTQLWRTLCGASVQLDGHAAAVSRRDRFRACRCIGTDAAEYSQLPSKKEAVF